MVSKIRGGPFRGRSICVGDDLNPKQLWYLFMRTNELKKAIRTGDEDIVNKFILDDRFFGIYLAFFEKSSRTKESFRNVAKFHGIKLNDFEIEGSSRGKGESLYDTFRTLLGYDNYVFVLRTELEGVCRLLEKELAGLDPRLAFINGGDGAHAHPTQTYLDLFTLLEQNNFERDHIHLAMFGDLLKGRTVHSLADGLKIFKGGIVDLIAPDILGMPEDYVEGLKHNGFTVRKFGSIDEYLEYDVANSWYLTRIQLERLKDNGLDKIVEDLRETITLREDHLKRVPKGVMFYHPMPRKRESPVIPRFLDSTPFCGWWNQSRNGYLTRIVELAMISGLIGDDFEEVCKDFEYESFNHEEKEGYLRDVEVSGLKKSEKSNCRIEPIENGFVIDHINKGESGYSIERAISNLKKYLEISSIGVCSGTFYSSNDEPKGLLSVEGDRRLTDEEMKTVNVLTSMSTCNNIEGERVVRKVKSVAPLIISGYSDSECKNQNCVSNPKYSEGVVREFHRKNGKYVCPYCEQSHSLEEIWR